MRGSPKLLIFTLSATWPAVLLAQNQGAPVAEEAATYSIRQAAREGRSISLSDERPATVPEVYTVRRGDTLWDICAHFYDNPWQWPRVWSFNERITNPNWIYPGDPLRLGRSGPPVAAPDGPTPVVGRMIRDSVYLRDSSFVERDVYDRAGVVVGSPSERTLLSELDEVYVEFESELGEIPVGQEYAVFRQARPVEVGADGAVVGHIVEILGTVKVTSVDRDRRLAEGLITESIEPIERGHRVAPIERRFVVTPPVRNEVDLRARVLESLLPVQNIGQHQIVYIDKGFDDGVREGNRFFVLRRGDEYQRSIEEPDLRPGFPYEVIGELRVVDVRRHTATTIVMQSVLEIQQGEIAEMRRGY